MGDLDYDLLLTCNQEKGCPNLSVPNLVDELFFYVSLLKPTLGGYNVANQEITLRPELTALYTSGSRLDADMSERFISGHWFLQKPYSIRQLEF